MLKTKNNQSPIDSTEQRKHQGWRTEYYIKTSASVKVLKKYDRNNMQELWSVKERSCLG